MARGKQFALVTGSVVSQRLKAVNRLLSFSGVVEAESARLSSRSTLALVSHAIATVLPAENSDHLTEAGITWFPLDVTVEKSVIDLKQSILALTGGYLDFLVNNAWVRS